MNGWVKICGVTTIDDAERAFAAGADAVGLNVWSKSRRALDSTQATAIADAVRGRGMIVLVTVDLSLDDTRSWMTRLRPHYVQLHGDETDALVSKLVPQAYKAVGLGTPRDVEHALSVPGDLVLIDARDDVRRGGTGKRLDDTLARSVISQRRTILAGGLTPANVGAAVRALKPYGVDVASGVEGKDGRKEPGAMNTFVREARAAFADNGPHV